MFNLFKKPKDDLPEGFVSSWVINEVLDMFMAKYNITREQIDKVKVALDLVKTVDKGDSVEITITIKK